MDLSSHDSPLLPLVPCRTCADGMATRAALVCERCTARRDVELEVDLLALTKAGPT